MGRVDLIPSERDGNGIVGKPSVHHVSVVGREGVAGLSGQNYEMTCDGIGEIDQEAADANAIIRERRQARKHAVQRRRQLRKVPRPKT